MRDKTSFPFRLIETERSRMMTVDIAADMQKIAHAFIGARLPGESVKAALRRGWEIAGRPPFWRFRAAFYGEAGPWSAQAVASFQQLYRAHLDREARRADQAQAIERAKRSTAEPDFVRIARGDLDDLRSRIAAIETALRIRS